MPVQWTIGIDEVGRGALAGPVTVGAFALRHGERRVFRAPCPPLRDSKKLSPEQRTAWTKCLRAAKRDGANIWYTTASMSPKAVDKLNVAQAANWAATRAVKKLLAASGLDPRECRVLLDGGLYLKEKFEPPFRSVETIVKGDEKFSPIMLASIVAKVTRDRKLERLHRVHPEYGFAKHKGYGTRAHVTVIKERGIVAVHRLTFVGKWVNLTELWHEQVITRNRK